MTTRTFNWTVFALQPNRRVACLAAICLVVVMCAQLVRADGGAPLWSGRAGGYEVAVFQSPSPLRVGVGELSVLVQDAVTRELLTDAQTTVRFAPRSRPQEVQSVEFNRAATGSSLFQSAVLQLPESGWWEFELLVAGPLERTTVQFDVQVADAQPRWLSFWPLFSWPAIAVALFGVHQWLVSRTAARRT
jgi:hypothetical protein